MCFLSVLVFPGKGNAMKLLLISVLLSFISNIFTGKVLTLSLRRSMICKSPYFLPHNFYVVGLENLVLNELIIPWDLCPLILSLFCAIDTSWVSKSFCFWKNHQLIQKLQEMLQSCSLLEVSWNKVYRDTSNRKQHIWDVCCVCKEISVFYRWVLTDWLTDCLAVRLKGWPIDQRLTGCLAVTQTDKQTDCPTVRLSRYKTYGLT